MVCHKPQSFGSSFWNVKCFLNLLIGSYISGNISNFLRVGSFLFFGLGKFLPEIKNVFIGFNFRKYKKSFLLTKYKKCFNPWTRKLYFVKFKKIKEFFLEWIFLYFELGLKSALGTLHITTAGKLYVCTSKQYLSMAYLLKEKNFQKAIHKAISKLSWYSFCCSCFNNTNR